MRAFDAMGADNKADFFVTVIQGTVQPSFFELDKMLTDAVAASDGKVIETKSLIVAIISTAMAIAGDCTAAPNCSALNRHACTVVFHTCGPCHEGYFGEPGHHVSNCLPSSRTVATAEAEAGTRRRAKAETHKSYGHTYSSTLTSSACIIDDDCDLGRWEKCNDDFVCVETNKRCVNDCSGHGSCVFKSIYDKLETNAGNAGATATASTTKTTTKAQCSILDYECSPMCECSGGYTGIACYETPPEFDVNSNLFANAMHAIVAIEASENDA
jgi:hypothetical protein